MYPAKIIAEYVINYCDKHNINISNLKLQKLLYFIQGEAYRKLETRLIKEDFYAWELGPVIPEIYKEYAIYSSLNLPAKNFTYNFSDEETTALDSILRDYTRFSAWELVDISHDQDPWKYTNMVFGEKALIPFESIQDYFREVGND